MEEECAGDAPTKKHGESREASVQLRRGHRRGIISRIWRGIVGARDDDYERKLQRLSKQEAQLHARITSRLQSSTKMARNLIILSVTFEVMAVVIAVIAARSLDLTGPMKFVRTLPAFLLPGFSYIVYSSLERLTRMLDRKDQKALERLRAERKAKIDELKERTNYYTTQKLIQRYDSDPAAKIAAATVLASRLGAETGLKVNIGDDPPKNMETTKSNGGNVEAQSSIVLRNRKQAPIKERLAPQKLPEVPGDIGSDHRAHIDASPGTISVEHYRGSGASDGGWVARIAALLLVTEVPSQCCALICGHCHKHNGLARKEEFPHITYYCPQCHALNTLSSSSKLIADTEDLPPRSSINIPQ